MSERHRESGAPLPHHLSLASGVLMGGADAIPGVSGGTIALILGIYDKFIESLSRVVRAPLLLRSAEGRRDVSDALRFLVPLGLGIVVAYYLATKFLVGKTESPGLMLQPESAPACYGFFFGLVLLSIREPWRRIEARDASHFAAAVLGCAAAVVFVGLPHAGAGGAPLWQYLLGGAGAISVMLLPGVSGSLFLVIIGQYTAVAGAVHDRNTALLAMFLVGIGLGVLLFVPMLRLLLRRYHDYTMALLTGLMAGSLRALWPWKSGYDPKHDELANRGIGEDWPVVLVAALAGGLVVWFLARLERKILRADNAAAASAPPP